MPSHVRVPKRSTVGGTKATHENPRKEKSHSPFHLGSPEGELLVRPTGHVPGSDLTRQGGVLGRCTHPNEMLQNNRFVLSGSVVELRSTLITMATTTLATAGVVFTLLTLLLSTVAAQYGSRLLRVFLGDRITQFVLSMFVGTFVYCITAALPPAKVQFEGSQITATVGLLLMLATFASLILLVQHISTMLLAPISRLRRAQSC